MPSSKIQIIKVKIPIEQISGDTYAHRETLKQLGCMWNSQEKHWERQGAFTEEELKLITKLGLNIQHSSLIKTIELEISPIRDIIEAGKPSQVFSCLGYVKECEPVRSFIRGNGTTGYIQRFLLIDHTSCMSCIVWDLTGASLLENDIFVVLQNVMLKGNENKNELELHSIHQTNIWAVAELPFTMSKAIINERYQEWIMHNIQSLQEIHPGFNQKFKGMITDVLGLYDYESETIQKLMTIIIMDDGTQAIKVSLFGELCNELLAITEKEQNQIIQMHPLDRIDSSLFAEKVNELIGKEIVVRGTVEENEYTKLSELKARRFYKIDKELI